MGQPKFFWQKNTTNDLLLGEYSWWEASWVEDGYKIPLKNQEELNKKLLACHTLNIPVEEVKEKKPRQYLKPIGTFAEVMSIADWKRATTIGAITELDGIGRWCKDGKEHSDEVFETSQEDATHVAWYKNE